MAGSHLIFLGTYTRSGASRGIHAVRLDRETGRLSAPWLAAEAADPGWLEFSPDRRLLYVIHASPAQAVAYRVEADAGRLTPLNAPPPPTGGMAAPCHLALDRASRVLLAANYHEGLVASLPVKPDGSLGTPNVIRHAGRSAHPARQEKPHVHSVTLAPDERFVIVADLGTDRVVSYPLQTGVTLGPAAASFAAKPGAGPRHAKFSRDGRHLHVVNELDNTITTLAYDPATGALRLAGSVNTLPDDFAGASTAAEIRVHPSGRFVYASNRGHDSIAVFEEDTATGHLRPAQTIASGGRTPRNFALSPDGRWLVCGHQDTPLLTVFAVDAATGRLTRTPHTAEVPVCICVAFLD
ncbi:MAG: lactonase family protein [Opitutaceae bacterium]